MKVAYFCKAPMPSRMAGSIHVMKMCQAMAHNGYDVVLFILSEKNDRISRVTVSMCEYYGVDDCFKIVRLSILSTKGSQIRYALSSVLATGSIIYGVLKAKPDIVFGRDLLACFLSALIGKKVIFESHFPVWHGMLESALFKLLLKLSHFKRLVVISESLRKTYLEQYRELDTSGVVVAHDGADIVSGEKLEIQLKGNTDQLDVGYVGHLYKGKGIEVIAAIASSLPDINFHIIGGLDEDITYWRSKIVESNVFFYGFISQNKLSSYIHSLDICLLPNQKHVEVFGAKDSRRKPKNISDFTSPLKMFEYMAHKKPIIASDLPVLREVLNDECALLVPPEDAESWIQAIEKLKDNNLREILGKAGYQLFVDKYTWKKRAKYILAGLH